MTDNIASVKNVAEPDILKSDHQHDEDNEVSNCKQKSTPVFKILWAHPWSSGSVFDYRSLPPVFESRRGHI